MLIELSSISPHNEYMLKVKNESPRKRCDICPKLKTKTPDSQDSPFENDISSFYELEYTDDHYILFSL